MIWRRGWGQNFVLECLKLSSLAGWDSMIRVKMHRLAQFKFVVKNLSILHIESVQRWFPEVHDLSHCKALRELSVTTPETHVEAILNSTPPSLESLSLSISSTTTFSVVDKLLESRISSNLLPKLQKLRLLRLRGEGDPQAFINAGAFRRMKVASSTPLTAMACEVRHIEYVVWF